MKLNEDELKIIEKVKIYDRNKQRLFIDYNTSNINVMGFLVLFALFVLGWGMFNGQINAGFGFFAGMCFVGAVFQMAFQMRTMGILIRKQSLLINDFIAGYSLPDDSLKLREESTEDDSSWGTEESESDRPALNDTVSTQEESARENILHYIGRNNGAHT